jgi:hypothetical protein
VQRQAVEPRCGVDEGGIAARADFLDDAGDDLADVGLVGGRVGDAAPDVGGVFGVLENGDERFTRHSLGPFPTRLMGPVWRESGKCGNEDFTP